MTYLDISPQRDHPILHAIADGRALMPEETDELCDIIARVQKYLAGPSFSRAFQEDFRQSVWLELLSMPSKRLRYETSRRTIISVMFFIGRTVRYRLLRELSCVTRPKRVNETVRQTGVEAQDEPAARISHEPQSDVTQRRAQLVLIACQAEPQVGMAMGLMLETGADPGEAAQYAGLSRPTFLRKLKTLGAARMALAA